MCSFRPVGSSSEAIRAPTHSPARSDAPGTSLSGCGTLGGSRGASDWCHPPPTTRRSRASEATPRLIRISSRAKSGRLATSIDLGHERLARNESHFREINERIEASNAAHHWVDPPFADWVCECARTDCSVRVQMTVDEYEAVRSEPTHFLVAPHADHVVSAVEQVVLRHERYWVVEKLGDAGKLSDRLDNRPDGPER